MPRLALVVAVVALPAIATAAPYYPKVAAGGGVGLWIGDVGALTPIGPTVQLAADVEVAPTLHLRAIYEHAFLDAAVGETGSSGLGVDGLGLVLHHPIFAFPASEIRVGGDLHVLAGVERTWLAWEAMPTFTRTEIVLGFGCSLVVHDRATRRIPQQQIDIGLRMLFARAPEPGMSPAVAPATTLPFDRSLIVEVAWRYGR